MKPLTLNRFRPGNTQDLLDSLYGYSNVNENPFQFSFRYDVSGGSLSSHTMNFQVPETTIGIEDTESLRLRVICHVLLDLISDEALPEILESMKEAFEFYKERPKTDSFPTVRDKLKFKLGQKQERPIFHIAQE